MRPSHGRRGRGFTLVETAVSLTIIAVVAAIMFPVFARAKESALITESAIKQKQFFQAFMMYQADNGGHTGAFGHPSASNLPNHHYYGQPLVPYGITNEFRKTPCGSKAPLAAGWIASHVSEDSIWVTKSPLFQESSLIVYDDNCNPGNEQAFSPYRKKRGLGVLYSGAFILKWNTGRPSSFEFFAEPINGHGS